MKVLVKKLAASLGLSVSRRDRLLELVPLDYLQSPFLPRIHRKSLGRTLYFTQMFERVPDVSGDIVECGTSIGHGILLWALLSDLAGADRTVWGFDSFSGFPDPTVADKRPDGSLAIHRGKYRTPPEIVQRVLTDGGVSAHTLRDRVRIVKGFFEESLCEFEGTIAILHLDCDLYESYKTCLEALYDKVASGGLILFDEYADEKHPGCRRAVDEFFRDKPEKPVELSRYRYSRHYVVKA